LIDQSTLNQKDANMTTALNSRTLKLWMLAAATVVTLVACGGGGGGGGGGDVPGAPPVASGPTPAFPLQPNAISAARNFTCAIKTGGLACWGSNNGEVGALGNDSTLNSITPVNTLSDSILSVSSAGGEFNSSNADSDSASCSLSAFGQVFCWGSNEFSQLGTRGDILPFSRVPIVVGSLDQVVSLTKGLNFSCAVVNVLGGTAREGFCWGNNQLFQLGNSSVQGGFDPTPVVLNGVTLRDVDSISAGFAHACAMMLNGTVNCWGGNGNGQLGLPLSTQKSGPVPVVGFGAAVRSISAGPAHNCAVLVSGKVACWGDNSRGQLGDGTLTGRLAPTEVLGVDDAVAVSAGNTATCAIRATGAVLCWGEGTTGQLGNGQFARSLSPVAVQGLQDAVAISVGEIHTCAIRANKTAVCWGRDILLGSVVSADSAVPVEVAGGAIFGK
jgi:alpha-tubulin suppressor-like RCC1 family protein